MTQPEQNAAEAAPTLDLKKTLLLPETAFAMKANLPQREPARLAQWESEDLYGQIRQARAGAEKYLLHDGPPYANGALHFGHALNKCLKDFVVKTKTMAGFDSPFVPGWDCHGLPIEIKVDEHLGRKKLEMAPIAMRQACREYAQKYLDLQRSQFMRLGVFGRWQQPYSTMTPEYESAIVRAFFDFFERGFVYKGLKPVYWCIHDRTALAEAEVEYEQHTSPSVWVKYPLTSDPAAIDAALAGRRVNTIIWTTTPWTLPASLAVAFHPELEYIALEQAGEVYIVAAALEQQVRVDCTLQAAVEVARFPGAKLDRVTFQHPFLDRQILGVTAEYVTTEQGTGAVHTAPAHGVDDFHTGTRYGLDQLCNVDNSGRLRNGLEAWEGKTVFQANPIIVEHLRSLGVLMGYREIHHSYPHCWRCHRPVIFRATEQWFIRMESPMQVADAAGTQTETTFRELVLEEIKRVNWDPAWGQDRITNMVAARPDWCISRQRTWGVPIAVFLCEKCHEPLADAAVDASIVALFAAQGADAWYTHEVAELLPAGTTCKCGGTEFRKEMDILDVWFESGASQAAVLGHEPDLPWPADLYLEGGDQHRGWFQSSLLCGVGVKHASPYRKAATVGWVLDENGRALSKSLGNGEDPAKIADRLGAEVIRLWVASVDFREDVAISENLLARNAEAYRKLRNTVRYLLGSLHKFDAAHDAVPFAEMQALDQYMLVRCAELAATVEKNYAEFEFHRAYQAINEFCIVDLSAVYLDLLKDRMYTFAPSSAARRSAQSAIWTIAETLVRLLAPFLTFTCEEAWEQLPPVAGREASVHLATFLAAGQIAPPVEEDFVAEWRQLFAMRDEVLKSLEAARQEKRIGKSLEAKVQIAAAGAELALLQKYQASLKELFNVSQVQLSAGDALSITTLAADGGKCERCWNFRTDIGTDERWPTVCTRCVAALEEIVPLMLAAAEAARAVAQ